MSKTWQGGMKYVLFVLLLFASKIICGQASQTITGKSYYHNGDVFFDSRDCTRRSAWIYVKDIYDTIRPVQHGPDKTYMDSADHYIIYNGEVYPSISHLLTLFPKNECDEQVELLEYRREVLQVHKAMIERENKRVRGEDTGSWSWDKKPLIIRSSRDLDTLSKYNHFFSLVEGDRAQREGSDSIWVFHARGFLLISPKKDTSDDYVPPTDTLGHN